MSDKLVLDKDTFKSLASDTRINILKEVFKKAKTQSELAEIMNLSVPSIKDHLNSLEKSGLIEKDDSRKWKYYSLTSKGEYILRPEKRQFMLILSSTTIVLLANIAFYYKKYMASSATFMAKSAADSVQSESIAMNDVVATRAVPMAIQEVAESPVVSIDWVQIALGIVLLGLVGLLSYKTYKLRKTTRTILEN